MYFSKFNHNKGTKEHMREWTDAETTKPIVYALNNLLLESGIIIRGWWTGNSWDGLKLKRGDVVISFKKCGE